VGEKIELLEDHSDLLSHPMNVGSGIGKEDAINHDGLPVNGFQMIQASKKG
jgi:hypothetical protein